MHKKIIAGLFVVVMVAMLMFTGCSDDDDNGNGNDTTSFAALDYFPLAVGNQWIYTDSSRADTSITEIVGTMEIDGYTTYIMLDDGDSSFFQIHNGAIYVYVPDFDSSWLMIPATFSIGDSWTSLEIDTTDTSAGYEYHSWFNQTVEVLSSETIEVPAGSYNCLKVQFIIESGMVIDIGDSTIQDITTDTSYTWTAKNVGSVKEVDSDGEIWELIEFTAGD
ncbi:hypothetical protein DRQ33_04525 [bacterium]|nr:MAG: hypothetical protein DRQ33_04525 [bacterium]